MIGSMFFFIIIIEAIRSPSTNKISTIWLRPKIIQFTLNISR